MLSKLNLKALVIGFTVDILGSVILGGVLGFAIGFYYAMQGYTQDQLNYAATHDPYILIGGLIIGIVFSYIGAMLATQNSPQHSFYNAIAYGALSILLVLVLLPVSTNYPNWLTVISFIYPLPIAYLAGKRHS